MERHGSESFFVEGEGLSGGDGGRTGTHIGGRPRTPGPAVSLLADGAEGRGNQLPEPSAGESGGPWRGRRRGVAVQAGFTYLGQFIDHDLTFDKTRSRSARSLSDAPPAGPLPSLDLDSLYGAGPDDPESAKFYEVDGIHLKVGKTKAVAGRAAIAGDGGLRPPGRRRDGQRRRSAGR